ncbi:MAG: hypothetical protein LBG20_03475 [Holosporaceae bacterium]|nr:hypothetical protein [Holosporaceae bacterium]
MRAKILKLDRKLFDGEITKVVVPATEGEICLLPHHMAIITTLCRGSVRVYRSGYTHPVIIKIDGGICSFSTNTATFIIH